MCVSITTSNSSVTLENNNNTLRANFILSDKILCSSYLSCLCSSSMTNTTYVILLRQSSLKEHEEEKSNCFSLFSSSFKYFLYHFYILITTFTGWLPHVSDTLSSTTVNQLSSPHYYSSRKYCNSCSFPVFHNINTSLRQVINELSIESSMHFIMVFEF